jgi:adenine-specific DNA-methyltransferase
LDSEDGLCFILPAQWLESDYAQGIRRWLWSARHRHIEMHLFESDLFREAQVDAVSLVVGPVRHVEQEFRISSVRRPASKHITRLAPCPSEWRSLFQSALTPTRSLPIEQGLPLSEIAKVSRGIATGANQFFVVTEDLRQRFDLPNHVLKPLIRRLRDHDNRCSVTISSMERVVSRDKRWLLYLPGTLVLDEATATYLNYGREKGFSDGHLCQLRTKFGRQWYDLSAESRIFDVVIGPAVNAEFRFLENRARAHITNNLYGLIWRTGLPLSTRQNVLRWLREGEAQELLRGAARTRGGGLFKLEPSALHTLRVPRRIIENRRLSTSFQM